MSPKWVGSELLSAAFTDHKLGAGWKVEHPGDESVSYGMSVMQPED